MALNVVEHRQLLYIVSMFMIVQFTGILLASQVFSGATFDMISTAQISTSYVGSILYIGFIVAFSLLIVVMIRFYKGDMIFTLLDLFVIISSSFVFFLIAIASIEGNAFNTLFGNSVNLPAYILAILLAIGLAVAKSKKPHLRNATAMIASVGVGTVLGFSFGFFAALIFMIILAVYDFIAVFITKHMVALGNMAVSKNLSLMIMASEVEAVPLSYLSKSQRAEYNTTKKDLSQKGPMFRSVIASGMAPMGARTALGTGDLAVPLMLSIAAYKVNLNFTLSFVVILGAILGLLLTMYTLKRFKRPLPAIPFLLFGILIALGIFFGASTILAI